METYKLDIVGVKRELPLIYVGKHTRIASFSILGDVELTDKLADRIADDLKNIEFDCLVGPEVKVVPLIHGVAKRLAHKRFIVCRKSIKSYMISPVKVVPLSHFPKHAKPLVINGDDAHLLKGKKVYILDDVVSTGITMRMIKYLMDKVGAEVVGYYSVFLQGTQFDKINNLTYMEKLPIFKE
ncbi:adenine phosphoribosyltransferase [Candidatus Microgenomates bacterium]|nr:MAG: adenine phosphoribosyltransferase [Candidatus Microgenomates bacterium]